MCEPPTLSSLTLNHSMAMRSLSPGLTTGLTGTWASWRSFSAQKASKSAGLGSAAAIFVGSTAAARRTRPLPPVL